MEEPTKIDSQLERLLACDLSEMGYQARVRHHQRIEELRTQLADNTALEFTASSSASEPVSNELTK